MRLLKSRVLFRWLPLFYSLILLFLRTLQNSKCSKILSWTVLFFFFLTSFQGTLSLLPHTEQQQRTKFVLLDITRFFSDALKPIRRSLMRKTSDTQGVWNSLALIWALPVQAVRTERILCIQKEEEIPIPVSLPPRGTTLSIPWEGVITDFAR